MNLPKKIGLRFVCVCIDHQIIWKDQITYISNKLYRSIAIIHRTSHVLDAKALYCLYDAIFQPYLNYCIDVCGNAYENNTNPVFIKLQKLFELSVMLGHWTMLLKCFIDLTF